MSMLRCEFRRGGDCVAHGGMCRFCAEDGALNCPLFLPHENVRESAMQRVAKWRDVAAKGRAIADMGGVTVTRDDSDQVDATVVSLMVAGMFPVTMGGPYYVTLARRAWMHAPNYGGWVQGYLCDCQWGQYHSGEPGYDGLWGGRFCSHAYATLIVANARAKGDFMNDRTAARKACKRCGKVARVSRANGLCRSCEEDVTFDRMARAAYRNDKRSAEWLMGNGDPRLMRYIGSRMEPRGDGSVVWNGRVAHVASRVATRSFSATEMDELENEIDGRELHNRSRLKAVQTDYLA